MFSFFKEYFEPIEDIIKRVEADPEVQRLRAEYQKLAVEKAELEAKLKHLVNCVQKENEGKQ